MSINIYILSFNSPNMFNISEDCLTVIIKKVRWQNKFLSNSFFTWSECTKFSFTSDIIFLLSFTPYMYSSLSWDLSHLRWVHANCQNGLEVSLCQKHLKQSTKENYKSFCTCIYLSACNDKGQTVFLVHLSATNSNWVSGTAGHILILIQYYNNKLQIKQHNCTLKTERGHSHEQMWDRMVLL